MAKPKQKSLRTIRIEQSVAAEILMDFMFTKSMDDVVKVWNEVFKRFDLRNDPFTGCPCTPEEYSDNRLEYDRQTMIERYGHCDGLE